jgi:hypothetical protein
LYQYIVHHRDADTNADRVTLAELRVDALKKQLAPVAPPPPRGVMSAPSQPHLQGPQPPAQEPNRVPAFALFGVAGAGLVVGSVAGGLALKQASDVKAACVSTAPCPTEALPR